MGVLVFFFMSLTHCTMAHSSPEK